MNKTKVMNLFYFGVTGVIVALGIKLLKFVFRQEIFLDGLFQELLIGAMLYIIIGLIVQGRPFDGK